MDDQNSSNTQMNDQQTNASQPDTTQTDQPPTPAPTNPIPQDVPTTPDANVNPQQQNEQVQTENQTPVNNPIQTDTPPIVEDTDAAQTGDYVENVGGSVVDLLNDVNESDDLVQIVANEMRLDNNKVKSLLGTLLNKINQGQITMEELALLMAAPVVDEPSE